jgi:hypothetical protein
MFSLTTRPTWFIIAMLGRSFSGREVESLEKLMSLDRRADTKAPVLLRLMIRVEPGEVIVAAAVILGIRRLVRRKWPMWFVANISSMPSGLRVAMRSGLTVWTMNPDAKGVSVRTSGNGLSLQGEQGIATDLERFVQAIGGQGRQISSENRTLPALLIRRSIVGTSFQLRTSAPTFLTELRDDKTTSSSRMSMAGYCAWRLSMHS